MARIEVPLVSCEGCGACCTRVGCPPGAYLYLAALPSHLWPQWVMGSPDVGLWQRVPTEAKEEVRAYYGTTVEPGGRPCVWLDQGTRRCRWYDHRPEVCRRFERGGKQCLTMRQEAGIGTD